MEILGALMAALQATTEPRFQAVMQEMVATILHDVIEEAQHAIPVLHGQPPSHVCDAWRWALTAGTVLMVSNVQALLALQGVLLTATVDVNTPMGVRVVQHVPLALTQGIPLVQYLQYAGSTDSKRHGRSSSMRHGRASL